MERILRTNTSRKTNACRIMGAVAKMAVALTAGIAAASDAMPVTQQNALVQKYCAVCHTDASLNGGLSLEHFDAGHADPGLAAMMVSKLKGKALGASGMPLPDRATQEALQDALTLEAAGAGKWTFKRTQDPASKAPILIAIVVRDVTSGVNGGEQDLYWLTLTCREDSHKAAMQLAWSPGVPKTGQPMSVAVDGNPPVEYTVEGNEKMGNGQAGTSGPGAIRLNALALPEKTLAVSNLFGEGRIVFPFDELNRTARQALSACFAVGGR
jgi:hypothetical protein